MSWWSDWQSSHLVFQVLQLAPSSIKEPIGKLCSEQPFPLTRIAFFRMPLGVPLQGGHMGIPTPSTAVKYVVAAGYRARVLLPVPHILRLHLRPWSGSRRADLRSVCRDTARPKSVPFDV